MTVLNGNGVTGSASNASYLLGQRGYPILTPPNGIPANAPSFDYFRTKIYFDPKQAGAKQAATKMAGLFGSADVQKATPAITALANDAMLTAVVGQTFHGTLAAAPVDQTPKREPANVTSGASASLDLLRERQKKVDFDLMVPTVLERSSWIDRERPIRLYRFDDKDKHKTIRLTYKMGSNDYWGVQESNWEKAPVLGSSNFTRNIGGRRYELFYNGPHLHMVVLQPQGRDLLGRQHPARPALERDDARDRQGPAADRQGPRRPARSRRPVGPRPGTLRTVVSASSSRVAVFGAGYVGLVTGACFAELGHSVVVRDVLPERIARPAARRGADLRARPRGADRRGTRERLTLHERRRRGDRRRRLRLHRGRHAADLLGRRRSLGRLDGDRRAAGDRPALRRRDEEHRAGRHGPQGAPPPRRARAASRSGTRRIPSSRPRAPRSRTSSIPTGSSSARSATRTATPSRPARGHRGPGRPLRRRVGGDDQARGQRRADDADLVHQRDRERLRGDRRRRRARRRGHRPRPADRPELPARRDRLRRLAASRRTRWR